jgi:adenylate cyclase
MASDVTVAECGVDIEFMELDRVAVKGRETPVAVFTVLAAQGSLDPSQAEARQEFTLGLELYRGRRFEEAGQHFLRALESWPGLTPASLFLGRCRAWQETPPPPDWDAVFRPEQK